MGKFTRKRIHRRGGSTSNSPKKSKTPQEEPHVSPVSLSRVSNISHLDNTLSVRPDTATRKKTCNNKIQKYKDQIQYLTEENKNLKEKLYKLNTEYTKLERINDRIQEDYSKLLKKHADIDVKYKYLEMQNQNQTALILKINDQLKKLIDKIMYIGNQAGYSNKQLFNQLLFLMK
jgi:chromosome segregation ATPase